MFNYEPHNMHYNEGYNNIITVMFCPSDNHTLYKIAQLYDTYLALFSQNKYTIFFLQTLYKSCNIQSNVFETTTLKLSAFDQTLNWFVQNISSVFF